MGEFAAVSEGKLEREATLAERVVEELVSGMPTVPEPDDLDAILDRAGIGDDAERALVARHLDELGRRREALATQSQSQGQIALDEGTGDAVVDLMNRCLEVAGELLKKAEQDAKGIDRDRLRAEQRELAGRRWLADQLGRFRRPVTTQGKLHKVARVQSADCELIEEMMTKYSRYVHAQPGESPVAFPGSDDLEGDLLKLREWLAEFSER